MKKGLMILFCALMICSSISCTKKNTEKTLKIVGFDYFGLYEDKHYKKSIVKDDILFINNHYKYMGPYEVNHFRGVRPVINLLKTAIE